MVNERPSVTEHVASLQEREKEREAHHWPKVLAGTHRNAEADPAQG